MREIEKQEVNFSPAFFSSFGFVHLSFYSSTKTSFAFLTFGLVVRAVSSGASDASSNPFITYLRWVRSFFNAIKMNPVIKNNIATRRLNSWLWSSIEKNLRQQTCTQWPSREPKKCQEVTITSSCYFSMCHLSSNGPIFPQVPQKKWAKLFLESLLSH